MARPDPNLGLTPSILDRLTDPESAGTAWRPGYGVDEIIEAVHRDLEELLNTRQSNVGFPAEFTEVHRSIMGYGLPDLTSLNAITAGQRQQIGRLIEESVSLFEPRLKGVRAVLVDSKDKQERNLRFRIEARLCLDPAPDLVFDTILEMSTGRYSVSAAKRE
ncbi:MAG: type VI secretion system baseplate subunit TssE [Planctomycetota bacterium]|nr:MAG: type VI secretion system baseplate subunit TssE [Planctomycetota bacterium]